LKQFMNRLVCRCAPVAPCAGAWIETGSLLRRMIFPIVAPCAGAWIETGIANRPCGRSCRRPLRGGVD